MRWEFQLLISMCSRRLVLYAICGGFCATHVSEFRELVCAASFFVVCISVELEVYANTFYLASSLSYSSSLSDSFASWFCRSTACI